MNVGGRLVIVLIAIIMGGGCASTKVSDRELLVAEKLPRPDHILIYDFVATPADVPADSSLAAADTAATPRTAEEIETARRVGAELATRLVKEIRSMGLPAERVSEPLTPQINDLVIRGYLISVKEGSTAKRLALGFGAGASELGVAVEFYQMTAQGLRKLGSGTGVTGGSKTPGATVPLGVTLATANPVGLIVVTGAKGYGELTGSSKITGRVEKAAKEIAKELEPRFREQGWIK
jgi:hypothetical protein